MSSEQLLEFMLKASEEDVITFVRLESIKANFLNGLQYTEHINSLKQKYRL